MVKTRKGKHNTKFSTKSHKEHDTKRLSGRASGPIEEKGHGSDIASDMRSIFIDSCEKRPFIDNWP
jgi:hypothetical protein